MYRILVPVDRNADRAMQQARYVSALDGDSGAVEATVLYVFPPGRASRAGELRFDEIDSAVDAADYLESNGVDVTRRVETGGAAQEIIDTVEKRDSHEIVMGGRKRSGVAAVLLGSVVQDVFLSAERPVTITGSEMRFSNGRRNVVVPVDRDRERARRQAEYVAGLPLATENVHATVLYVFPHQDYTGAPKHEFGEIRAAVDTAEFLEERGVAVERTAIGGEVERKILAVANDRDADSIVMGGRKRSGVQKVIMGSTAQDILLSANQPVTITG
ncbi:universal stress protein [Haloarcula marina]|uniref:universal stress protein n=1 Tax=Haloarcula marina TaxID=2961574 RepID=UPI002113DD30|nr:universal stress protein [Halomicroarcula marina]